MSVAEQARQTAARVDADEVGFDPVTILTIITQVLPLLISCWSRNDAPSPQQVKAKIRAANDRNPEQLLRRTAHAIKRDSEERISLKQARLLAQAVIEQALEADEPDVVACCNEVKA